MNIPSACLRSYYLLLRIYFLGWFFYKTCTSCSPLIGSFNRRCRGLYFSHELLSLFLLFFPLLINFFLLLLFVLLVLRLGLIKVTVKFISPGATLYVIFFIVVAVIQISKIVFALLCPERILFLLFFSIDQVIHFGSSSLSELHIPNC
jgi:hypothetical protein